ncbi:DUF2169 family type VI secretion system accessory protein [Shewanella surugensis]|uniref:Pentapeptide repeat-containing protein n=1 Tax=Shewanella surugensis TaxID=212020 RepID=A0ABT0LE90_9GAMM|nr:DUF2169 domain-containing protein [Shewanella surugensis]MCL1125975.1 pentapeptide repeat-containing protein [Shewanella surugensis]
MRIIKSNDHGILLVPFDLKGQPHLAVTMILGFDLIHPSQTISEQKLWQWINDSLKGQVFDTGMPKLKAEWLVSGHAYSGETARQHVRVSVSLAEQEKTLDVYGQRYWIVDKDKLVPSEPEFFTQMPLTWELTWGGEQVAENTLGCNDIFENASLPSIFYANRSETHDLTQAEQQSASFLPLAIEHPVRKECMGTYDEIWFREQWPNFPPDFDWHFFNQAPKDQWHSDYFLGGEFYSVINLNPDHESITGNLPYYQPRAFIRQQINNNVHQYANDEAEKVNSDIEYKVTEVLLRNDTVWFFPENQLGIRIFRGSVPVIDEEALDVTDVLLVTEEVGSKPKTLEHYAHYIDTYQITKEYEPEGITQAKDKMQLMLAELAQAKKNLLDLPSYFKFKQAQLTNKIPAPSMTPSMLLQSLPTKLDANIAKLEKFKTQLLGLPVPKSAFNEIEKSITNLKQSKLNFINLEKSYQDANQQVIKQAKSIPLPSIPTSESPEIKRQYNEAVQKVKATITSFEPNLSDKPWHDKASQTIALAQLNLERYSPKLKGFGFRNIAIKKHMLVYIHERYIFSGKDWGLKNIEAVCVPQGWLLPEYHDAHFVSLTSRVDLFEGSCSQLIEGSEPKLWYSELVVGQAVLLCQDKAIAWLLAQDLSPYTNVIEMSSPKEALSDEAQQALDKASQVFIFMQGIDELDEWKQAFLYAELIHLKDEVPIQDAYKEGLDLVDWFLPYLKPNESDIVPSSLTVSQKAKQQAKLYLPNINIQKMVDDQYQSSLSNMGVKPGQTIAQAVTAKFMEGKKTIIEGFPSPSMQQKLQDTVKVNLPQSSKEPFSETIKKASDNLNNVLEVSKRNLHEPATLDKITQGGNILQSGMDELADFIKESDAKMAAADVSVDKDIPPLSPLTREEVIQYKNNNVCLSEKDLSGLDLSGLDLADVDFSKSIMSEANLTNTDVSNAQFNGVIGDGIILDAATAVGACFDKAMLVDASFKEADLSQSRFFNTMASGANFDRTVFKNAYLHKISAIEASFVGSDLQGSDLSKGIFLNAVFDDACLAKINGTKMKAFQASAINSQWHGATLTKALFWEAELDNANLSSIDAVNARFAKAKLNHANLSGSHLMKANFSESELFQADLSESNLESSCFNQTLAKEANFEAVNLKRAQCMRSDFSLVNFNGSNAMQANFMRSTLTSSQLKYLNLYNADLYKVTLGNNLIKGCNFKGTLLANKEDYINE